MLGQDKRLRVRAVLVLLATFGAAAAGGAGAPPAESGTLSFFRCADQISLAVVAHGQSVSLTSFRVGQRPDLSGELRVVPATQGRTYRSDEWTWTVTGSRGQLEFHGKLVAQACTLMPAPTSQRP
ncbi:hypothetical protein DKM44_10220 [Deinococcus irradiatisoli]|uniref:C-type lysozyme inhibitor domain-containing protein n=1 Tax=Deinococcus irradiatisoli TaxID=2202254 RepID=A0A2Z3JS21_9DEIO|nr:hypothetical protein [Deinococcus irradiatisoli]AWN23554.1 hypothetical protein DKM44_10220 [Deinococcus irradiatisoli]